MKVRFTVNQVSREVDVPGARRLLDVLREDLGLAGTKEGCGEGECGACSVFVGDRLVNSCLIPVAQVDGESIVTIEGLAARGGSVLQDAFIRFGAAQCGICTPGMLLAAQALVEARAGQETPSRDEIREALAGNLCRCTGYQKIIDAVQSAFEQSGTTPAGPESAQAV
jgi:carbon-monoxide dehydrogenase small subunit